MEGAGDGGLGEAAGGAVIDGLDQHGYAKDVGEQDELLPHVVTALAGGGEEGDRLLPFLPGQPGLLDDGVQMRDERCQHLPQAGRGGGETGRHHLRGALLGEEFGIHVGS